MKLHIDLSKPSKWKPLAWLIMLCEGSKFSHASIRMEASSLDRELIYQATGSGVHFLGRRAFDENHLIVKSYTVEISDSGKVKLLQWCVDSCGKPYGKLQLLGIGLKRAAQLFGWKIKNPFASKDANYICCKLAVVALEEAGFYDFADPDEIGLNELEETLDIIIPQ